MLKRIPAPGLRFKVRTEAAPIELSDASRNFARQLLDCALRLPQVVSRRWMLTAAARHLSHTFRTKTYHRRAATSMEAPVRTVTALKRWSCQDKQLPPVNHVKNIHIYDFDNTRV